MKPELFLKSLLKRFDFLKSLKFSQRNLFWGIVVLSSVILIIFLGILPMMELKKNAKEEIAMKRRALSSYEAFLKSRDTIKEDLDRTLDQFDAVQQKLLPGETAQIGSAGLQETVKRLSERSNISIRSFRMLEPQDLNIYRKVSLNIEFNPVSSLAGLGKFIYDIEHDEKELMISEMDLLTLNPRMPNSVQGNMVVSGFMRKSPETSKEKER